MRRFDFEENDDFLDQEDMDLLHELGNVSLPEGLLMSGGMMPYQDLMKSADNELLKTAIVICQNSWFWKFRSLRYKLDQIAQTYTTLKYISEKETELDLEDEEENAIL